jgi:glutamine cyclotransferase
MKKVLLAAVSIVLIISISVAAYFALKNTAPGDEPLNYSYSVVHTYPHDPSAFTEGLVYDEGALYESTGLVGESTLRRVNLETGTVLQQVSLGGDFFG